MQNPIRSRGTQSLGLIVVGAIILATIAGMALTYAALPDAGMWHYDGTWTDGHMAGWGVWGWGMMLFGVLWMVLLIGLPVYLVYWLVTRSQTEERHEDSALTVLREQYARGEIDDEEFERRRARLTANR